MASVMIKESLNSIFTIIKRFSLSRNKITFIGFFFHLLQLIHKQHMPRQPSSEWPLQADQLIIKLRQEQSHKKRVDWQMIAEELRAQINFNKTSKQCRVRYINFLQFGSDSPISTDWSENQINLLIDLYIYRGPAWAPISKSFAKKSENSIKNKFNNALSLTAKALKKYRQKGFENQISAHILSTLLKAMSQIVQKANIIGKPVKEGSQLLKFRAKLVNMCFKIDQLSEEQIGKMIRLISAINKRFKSYNMFKVKRMRSLVVLERIEQMVDQFESILKQGYCQTQVKIQHNAANQIQGLAFPQNHIIDYSQYLFYWSIPFPQIVKKQQQ